MLQKKLKNDDGDAAWLEFFREVSRAFEVIEYLDNGKKYISLPSDLDVRKLYKRIKVLDKQNNVLKKLEAFSGAMSF